MLQFYFTNKIDTENLTENTYKLSMIDFHKIFEFQQIDFPSERIRKVSIFEFFFQKKFHRTDSGESSNSSLASFGLSLLYRNNSRKTPAQRMPGHFVPPPPPSRGMVERTDSAINLSGASAHSTIEVPAHPPLSASTGATCPSVALAFEDSGSKGSGDEVTIVVGRRKNSTTKAVR